MPSLTPSDADPISFTFLHGLIEGVKTELEPITRPGADGIAVRDLGSRGEIFQMIGIRDCDDLAAAKSFLEALEALQGSVDNQIVDDYGSSYSGLILWKVQLLEKKKVMAASGGISNAKGALVSVSLLLQKAS